MNTENPDEWLYSTTHDSPCQILEERELWGSVTCQVWLQTNNTVATVPKETIRSLETAGTEKISSYHIRYLATAARIADLLEKPSASDGVLLAPLASRVIPLPHQITALTRALEKENIRYLLADEVGLGKTIEAGLILKELKLRGRIKRILIVAPKGLTGQWAAEMKNHFNEEFAIVLPSDITTLRKVSRTYPHAMPGAGDKTAKETNPWTVFHQVITPMDSVKPLDRRKGWSSEQVASYNRDRFGDLIAAGWDLVIVDESHRLGGSTDSVARYRLGKGLAACTPYILLLSATPHQGKTDAFFRLVSLLDHRMFPTPDTITRDTVAPYVIRTIKRDAIDGENRPLFKPRTTSLLPIRWEERHHRQKELYEAVTTYIREGYNEAISEKKQYIGFLMVLMQRLVVSSTAAIEQTLKRRLKVLNGTGNVAHTDTESTTEEYYDMDGEELLDTVVGSVERSLAHEKERVQDLLALAQECRETGPDARAEALIDLILRLRREEQDPDLKILIFTEFISTQEMLCTFLTDRGFSAAVLNGTMSTEERNWAQNRFMEEAQFLISTDAGGEGLNLQFCHVIINYDIPWNPMRLEQRIGRVDRIGQEHPVIAINFVFEDSVEFRVREVLEEKLAIIYNEFGIDKTGDVLDSAIAGEIFEHLFIDTIIHPENLTTSVDRAVDKIHTELEELEHHSVIMQIADRPNTVVSETLQRHPLPSWLEQMTVAYLLAHKGKIVQHLNSCHITWPDGTEYEHAIFTDAGTTPVPGAITLTPDDVHIKDLISNIPAWSPGALIPGVHIPDLPEDVSGYWGLFEVGFSYDKLSPKSETLRYIPDEKHRYIPVFLSKDGKAFRQTARSIHDRLLSRYYAVTDTTGHRDTKDVYDALLKEATHTGEDVFRELQEQHQVNIRTETLRAERSFAARRAAIDQHGLGEVRSYRLRALTKEMNQWNTEIAAAEAIIPRLRPVLLLNILSNEDNV